MIDKDNCLVSILSIRSCHARCCQDGLHLTVASATRNKTKPEHDRIVAELHVSRTLSTCRLVRSHDHVLQVLRCIHMPSYRKHGPAWSGTSVDATCSSSPTRLARGMTPGCYRCFLRDWYKSPCGSAIFYRALLIHDLAPGQAESVSRNLGVPVLLHSTKKPGCSKAVLQYFNSRREGMVIDTKGKGRLLGDSLALSLPAASCTMRAADEQSQQAASKSTRKRILVIGDRVMTDVILGNRMNARSGRVPVDGHSDATFEAVPILCTRLWQAEGFLTRVMRNLENLAMRRMFARFTRLNKGVELDDWKLCVVREEEATPIEPAVQKAGTVQDRLRKSFWNLAASLGRTLYRPFQPVIQSMQEVSREAGQLHYGFRRPESLRNLKDLRNRIETFQASPKVRPGADG